MQNIHIFTPALVGMIFGPLLIVAGGSTFGANPGVIVFGYGLLALSYASCLMEGRCE